MEESQKESQRGLRSMNGGTKGIFEWTRLNLRIYRKCERERGKRIRLW